MHRLRVPSLFAAAVLCAGCAGADVRADRPAPASALAAPVSALSASPSPTASPSPRPTATPSPRPKVVPRGDGRLVVVPGGSATVGTGPLRTYAVEVEGGLGVDPKGFAAAVDRTLADPRSWTAGGRRALRRVSGAADLRVALASPDTTDRLCRPLQTRGRYSCAVGDRAVVNAARWLTGAPSYAGDLTGYRSYVVDHELGLLLGHHHVRCPRRGAVAPVMVQQTIGLQGCLPGPWPYP